MVALAVHVSGMPTADHKPLNASLRLSLQVEEKLIMRMIERQQEQLQQAEQLEADQDDCPVQHQQQVEEEQAEQEGGLVQQQHAEGDQMQTADGPAAASPSQTPAEQVQHAGLSISDLAEPEEMEEI
jgi:hypothetical protein